MTRFATFGFVAVLALGACSNMQSSPPAPAPQATLYDKLGGQPALTAVVDDFIGNVAADNRINSFFAHANIPELKSQLVTQICQATGGPCTYTGPSMHDVHHGMGITDADFNALVEDLVKSLNKFNVPQDEQQQLLAILGPMRSQIVGA